MYSLQIHQRVSGGYQGRQPLQARGHRGQKKAITRTGGSRRSEGPGGLRKLGGTTQAARTFTPSCTWQGCRREQEDAVLLVRTAEACSMALRSRYRRRRVLLVVLEHLWNSEPAFAAHSAHHERCLLIWCGNVESSVRNREFPRGQSGLL